ncbi:hypothetical protein [Aerosakkonema funiforme]|nr:hypothetical protein [Aerosakkonema funiforme]
MQENAEWDGETVLKQSQYFDEVKREELEDTIEILRQQIEMLNQELRGKELQLQELEQELSFTNEQLCAYSSQQLTFKEAKELAKYLLASQKSSSESLAELLSAIYGYYVKGNDLKPTNRPSYITPVKNAVDGEFYREEKFKILQLREQLKENRKQIKYQVNRLKETYNRVKSSYNKLQAQLARQKVEGVSYEVDLLADRCLLRQSERKSNTFDALKRVEGIAQNF